MQRQTLSRRLATFVMLCLAVPTIGWTDDAVQPSLEQRFTGTGELPQEIPDFQKHISPLMGRLGCNGRACHGSFQGRGGFRLSLFGYDFKEDHSALLEAEKGRVDVTKPEESLILTKPVDADFHEGGKRFEVGSWQDRVFRKWINAGAKFDPEKIAKLKSLDVEPKELQFTSAGQPAQLRAIAVWADGTREDVTGLCRFQTNDPSLVEINETGKIVSGASQGDTHVVVFYDNAVVAVPVIRPVSDKLGDRYPQVAMTTEIDRLVVDKLKKIGIVPSGLCDDATYLRRVSLDLAGTLPTEEEVIEFTKDQDPDKRAKLVERLMQTVGYAGWWTTKLCDWTGNSDPQLRNSVPNQSASALWYEWIYKRVQQNVPYDQIVQGIVEAKSRNQGETYIDYCSKMSEACREPEKFADREGMTLFWARNNFRTAEDRAVGFAYSFLGIRIQCAQCHKHPFDQWTKADFEKFSKLFGQVALNGNNLDVRSMTGTDKEMLQTMLSDLKAGSLKGNDLRKKLADKLKEGETVPFPELSVRTVAVKVKPQQKGKDKQPVPAGPGGELLGGGAVSLSDDTRDDLMAWLRSAENPYFAKALVNRVWAHYFGVGIVNPPDDLNLANPPSNAALLDHLAKEFIAHNFDLQWLHRTIIASDTYQRSWETNETNIHDRRNFSRFVPRRLPAEVLYDAMLIATSNDSRQEKLTSERKGRAVNVTDFDQRRSNAPYSYALGVFGRSTRESNCDCDRSEEPSLLQTVFLRNDKEVLQNLTSETGWVKQVAGIAKSSDKASADLVAAEKLEKALESYRKQMDKAAKDKGADKKKLAELKERMAQAERRLQAMQPAVEAAAGGKQMSDEELTKVVQSAFLRSVSREPNPEEISRSLAFIRNSKTPAEGIEGVMWALINTKEFSLNH